MGIFEPLYESAQRRELLLVEGGICHYHLRRDSQLTIHEIISTKPGAGSKMLRRLMATKGAKSLFAKCPSDLPSNEWYSKRGFSLVRREQIKSGRTLIHWRLDLETQPYRSNVGQNIELIYCGTASPMDEIALDHGFLIGSQMPKSCRYRPYFVDQNWKEPNRTLYMEKLSEYRPRLATVLDFERMEQLDEVLSWAEEAARYVETVIIIPKVNGGIKQLPYEIGGKPVRLGYSVPTKYAGTTVPKSDFAGWPVHLLGGSPSAQLELYHEMNVYSADQNYIAKIATDFCKYWGPSAGYGGRYLKATDGIDLPNAIYEAFRRSCLNVMTAWQQAIELPQQKTSVHQLSLFKEGIA